MKFAQRFSVAVQYNRERASGESDISRVCNTMMSENLGPPIRRLASFFAQISGCLDISYQNYLDTMRNDSWIDNEFKDISKYTLTIISILIHTNEQYF